MILIDVNILVYAAVAESPQHRAARDWLDRQFELAPRVGLPWQSLLGFLRLVTNPRVFRTPPATQTAWARVIDWLACEAAWIPHPGERHREILGRLLGLPGVRANLVHDAHLAALAIEHGLVLCSTDGDFARFPGLHWENPLV